ncbi:hypothetical protein PYCCODRAFT_1466559 [Trametes coccinea BRFM310]|uniref:Uncharacterized protein n=1 Tax=Trametes coccinea (strain BRFM310) TaxID=1353009 RepID=A0A1Y2ISP8_TRAC3|nr:hypothetical protein PYCCODRAFT_1466559 [Trametes coccinea BRFM310]
MVEKLNGSTIRPVRQAAQRSLKERRTSALFDGGALDSQLSDSQYIRDLVQSDQLSEKRKLSFLQRGSCLSTSHKEGAAEGRVDQLEGQDIARSNTPDAVREMSPEVPFLGTTEATKNALEQRISSEQLGAQSFLARLQPAELVAMNSVAMLIEKYRRRLEETQAHLDELTYAHFDLMNNCRRLEDHNARLRGALDEHELEIPDEEESQYV